MKKKLIMQSPKLIHFRISVLLLISIFTLTSTYCEAATYEIEHQACNGLFNGVRTYRDTVPHTSPSSDWGELAEDPSVVKHISTGLEFKRCFVGQTFDSTTNSCQNEPTLFPTIVDAFFYVSSLADKSWRITNIKEAMLTIEYCNTQPAFNTNVFPINMPGTYYRNIITSTGFSSGTYDYIYDWFTVDYLTGVTEDMNNVNPAGYVRLVRDSQ